MNDSHIIYEVNLTFDVEIAEEFREWLGLHVDDMLRIEGFESAEVHLVEEPEPPPGRATLSVRYRLTDRTALNAYLATHAERMRADGVRHFGDRFSATRRVLAAQKI